PLFFKNEEGERRTRHSPSGYTTSVPSSAEHASRDHFFSAFFSSTSRTLPSGANVTSNSFLFSVTRVISYPWSTSLPSFTSVISITSFRVALGYFASRASFTALGRSLTSISFSQL